MVPLAASHLSFGEADVGLVQPIHRIAFVVVVEVEPALGVAVDVVVCELVWLVSCYA